MTRSLRAMLAAIAAIPLLLQVTGRAAGEAPQQFYQPDTPKYPQAKTWLRERATLPPFKAPRTPEGLPDFQGRWNGAAGGGIDDLEEHEFLDVTTPPQESYVSDPADGKVPYTPWALAKRKEIRAGLGRGWPGETGARLYSDPAALCLGGMPRSGFGGQEIIYRPGFVIMLTANTYRVIPTDGRPHMNSSARSFFGDSRGRWEGETLVIDVTGLNGETWLDSAGNFSGPDTHVVERWTMVEANTINYEITLDDPAIYTRPWTMTYAKRRAGTGPAANGAGNTAAGAAAIVVNDPYAREQWEQTCFEGNGRNMDVLRKLGFKWFHAVAPPK